ncbi:MAG: transposase [Xanthobacteraceae bacterium]
MILSTAKWVKRRARAPRAWIRSAAGSALALVGPEQRARVSKNSKTGKAIDYSLKGWPALIRFLDDGRFSMTNTAAERQLHVIAIGRNNWILAGFDERVLLTSSIV